MAIANPATSPQTLGDYEVLEKIADGSMTSVHKGRHRETGKIVAIKILWPEFAANKVLRERFHQEFRVASLLRHPHLVRALDGGEGDGTSYLVMEYVEGEDLWQLIERDGPLPEPQAVRVICQVAEALSAAHARGIIHRDVKPDNILLTSNGQAKLADLGLSKDLRAEIELTRPDQGLGTPNFIAPEQFTNAKQAGVRCDVYALGATLYMAVTGKMPFQARGIPAVLKKKIDNALVLPRQIVPDLSERVDWAIRRAVRANPDERHATCLDFSNALTGQTDERGTSPAASVARAGEVRGPSSRSPESERRVSVRYPCSLQTQCNRNNSIHLDEIARQDSWEATIQDLSAEGIGLLVNRRFERGTILTVDLRGSKHGFERSMELRVTRVTRATRGSWLHGCVFAEPLSKTELRKLL
jgi:serine/threonine protein kinase